MRVVKNKVAPPFRTAEFDIMHDEGISREGDLLDLGVDMEVIEKRGSYYYYGEDLRLAQGRENAKDFLKENPDIADEIEGEIRDLAFAKEAERKKADEEYVDEEEDEPEED